MKQDTAKKSPKWLVIVIAIVALLAAAAVALVFILGGNNQGETQGDAPVDETPKSAVYYNLDRAANTDAETGLSSREKGEDGLYTIRFASEGKLVELKTADKQLVNYIDTMDTVGLVLDESGLIIDVLSVKNVATELARNFYVKKVDGNTITVNSSIAMNGMDIVFTLTDAASVMDVRPGTETLGESVPLEVMDMVSVYADSETVVTSVFLHERTEASQLYIRADRYYDSTTASTTRVPDKNGVYTIKFGLGGKIVELKCKDKNIVTGIDSGTDAKEVMGLTFDEEGYITGTITAATAARGRQICLVYHVTAINGNNIEATRLMTGSEQGKVVNFNLTEDTEIVMNEIGCNHFIGEYVEDLQMYDRIVVWGDMDNNAVYIKIDRRKMEGDDIAMYYLQNRMYDSTKLETSRVPDAKGYYVYEMAAKGKMVTVKTKDKKLASMIDANTWQFFGLKVQGGIIKEYYDANCISGGYGIGGQRFVTDVMANIVRIVSGTDFSSGGTYMLTDKTEIYNMTGYNGKLGSKTTLQVGDRVIANRDPENNITHIYVLDRPASGSTKMYYNSSRKYNGTTFETSRTPDADGYYVFTMYCEGKEVEVKTKDKAIATIIDLQNAPIAALKVNKDNIVTAAYPAIAGKKYAAKVFNYNYVGEITKDKVVSCYYYSNGEKINATASYPMAKNCKIYNVSTNYSSHRGEKSTLKVGDRIQALRDIETGELTHIWIMGRSINSPLYFHVARKSLSNGVTTRQPNADGYYEIELFVDGQIKTFRTKDQAIMTAVDAYDSEAFFALKTDGDIILGADAATASTKAANQVVSFRDVTKISGKNITVTRMRPGGSDHLQQTEFKITSKTKIYDICYYSKNQFKEVKLEKGDRISVFADRDGNVNYVFIMYPHTREEGYQAKCSHCNKTVWWEPYCGSFIQADNVHYYYPENFTRSQGTVGKDLNANRGTERFTAVLDMNGRTYTSTGRNFLVYFDLVLIDSVGGGVLEARGYQGGNGGNFMIAGGSVEINDGITVRMWDDPNSRVGAGGNFHVSNLTVKDEDGNPTKTYTGKVTINDAKLEGWPSSSGNFLMNPGTVLNLNGGTVTGGNIELVNTAKLNWKGGTIDSNLTVNGGTLALSGKPNFSGILMNSNGGKVDISNLSTEATIKALPSGVFTTEIDNADAYLNVFQSAAPESCSIVKAGKALSAELIVPTITDNLTFVPGTQMAVCPLCEQLVTWTPVTQAEYGDKAFGTPAADQHIYLAEDITWTNNSTNFINGPSMDYTAGTPFSACFHLNGHNFTGVNRNFAHGSYGILNVMGSGVVSGNATSGATITINTNRDTGGIILHSGTYTKATGNKTGVVQINSNGGMITIGKDAVIETAKDDLAVKIAGGVWIDTNLVISGTVKGGYVQSVAASKAGSTDTETPNLIYLAINGGNLEGGAVIAKDTILGLGGAAKIGGTGLDLTSGVKILVSELTEGAQVTVMANGVFTETIDVASQEGFYQPARFYAEIEERSGALWTEKDSNAPTLRPEPAVPAKPALLQVDNSNLTLNGNQAACPVCGKVVEWTPITEITATLSLEGEKHYYLANDITVANGDAIMYEVYQQKVTCLHLNGHNLTASNGWAIYAGGYLNVMGNGTVSGNSTRQHRGATVDTNSTAARLNLYGGTYTRNTTNVNPIINIHGGGGVVNMFEGAVVDTRGTTGENAGVRSWCGEFNMYGGAVYGSDYAAALNASNWTKRDDGTGSGTVRVFGGLVQAGARSAVTGGGTAGAHAHIAYYGGKIVGGATYSANTEMIVAGNPEVSRLVLPTDKTGDYDGLMILGELTEGASITVVGDGVFTFQCENAESYRKYFKTSGDKDVRFDNYALKIVTVAAPEPVIPDDPKVPALPTKLSVDNSNLVLDNNQAKCPVCDKVVTWTALTQEDAADAIALAGDTHYYLAEDLTYTGVGVSSIFIRYEVYGKVVSCLHLNGHNITATQSVAVFSGGYLNIMGNGIVKGNKNANGRAVTLEVNSTAGRLNVYGGTYLRYDKTNQRDMVRMNTAGGTINIYQGAIFGDPTRDSSTKGNTLCAVNGTLNIYGGELHGEYNDAVVVVGSYASDDVNVAATLNMFGGLVQAKNGSGMVFTGNANKKSVVNLYGGRILGGTALGTYTDMVLGGTIVMNRLVVASGAKFTLAEMAEGASVTLNGSGVFTNKSNNAANYLQYFHPLSGYKNPTVVDNALYIEANG